MTRITETMKQDAVDTAMGHVTNILKAKTWHDAAEHLGAALALANFAQVWSMVTPEDAEFIRDCARRAFTTSTATPAPTAEAGDE